METRQDHGAVPPTTTTRTDIGATANPKVSWAPYVSSILEQKESFDTRKREVYDTMMKKFLELNNLTWSMTETAICIVEIMEEKYGLPFCSLVQSCTGNGHKYQFVLFLFPDIFNGPQFVEIQKFCYYGKVTKRLLFIKTVA